MTCRFAYLAWVASSVFVGSIAAQPAASADPIGTWRGVSLCQSRPSACRDENVVYRISRTPSSDSVVMDGRKIVDGAEVEMGIIGCRLTAASGRLACPISNGVWQFTIRGDSLVGELRLSDGSKMRDVRTSRTPRARPPASSPSR